MKSKLSARLLKPPRMRLNELEANEAAERQVFKKKFKLLIESLNLRTQKMKLTVTTHSSLGMTMSLRQKEPLRMLVE